MKTTIQKLWNWYKGLPWYYKLVGWVVFVFVIFIWLYSVFKPGISDIDVEVDDMVMDHSDERINDLEDENKKIEKQIIAKKKEIATKLNQVRKIDARTLEGRKKIDAAKSMDDLDRLQKELGL